MATVLDYFANEDQVPESTLTELFFEAVKKFGDEKALQRFTSAESISDISYNEVLRSVMRVGGALQASSFVRGDRVAILSENRPEWAIVDYGALCSGILVVPIYPTLTAAQVEYVLTDSGAEMVFAPTPELAQKALEAADACSHDIVVVAFDGGAPIGTIAWEDFLDRSGPVDSDEDRDSFREEALRARPDDIATVLYTSGTTGPPKGVMLTHNNVASNVRATETQLEVRSTDSTISFLPLSHIFQRMADYLFFWAGVTIAYPRSMDTLIADLKRVSPTVVVSVPRIYEKIYNGVMSARGPKKKLIDWAASVADQAADLRLAGKEPSGLLAIKYSIADKLVFSKVKTAVGGRLRYFVSGGGPLAPALARFFYSIGLTIFEGFGLTETSPVTNVNTYEYFRIGTVGRPVPGTEIRIAEDGEILVRGSQVMKGYYNKPEATAEAVSEGGWFATGDIGELDADGFLSITDRKKDIIVTAGGKNIAPQPIENLLKTHPLVEQVVLIGDRRRYCSLIVVPAFEALKQWAEDHGIDPGSEGVLVEHPEVVAGVGDELLAMLGDLASFERPKKVALLGEELTVENGLMTPTLKVKRRQLEQRFAALIDSLYEDEAADKTAR